MNMKNSLQKRTPVQNLQMAVGTACAMGTATMLSTVMAYASSAAITLVAITLAAISSASSIRFAAKRLVRVIGRVFFY